MSAWTFAALDGSTFAAWRQRTERVRMLTGSPERLAAARRRRCAA
jgi:hypothetical protein